MSSVPEGIDLRRHRDEPRTGRWEWVKWAILVLLAAFLILGLLDLFGQRPSTTTIETSAARLDVSAPSGIRGGLLYQARFTIRPRRDLRKATLVLSRGWLEGMTVNTMAPSPLGEGSRDGSLVLELGHIPAGQEYVLYMQFQVNPTNVGRRSQNVTLEDGPERIAVVHRTITVFP